MKRPNNSQHAPARLARRWFDGRLAPVMGWTVVFCAVFIAVVASLGREARGAEMGPETVEARPVRLTG